jgi:hypothetical protein
MTDPRPGLARECERRHKAPGVSRGLLYDRQELANASDGRTNPYKPNLLPKILLIKLDLVDLQQFNELIAKGSASMMPLLIGDVTGHRRDLE